MILFVLLFFPLLRFHLDLLCFFNYITFFISVALATVVLAQIVCSYVEHNRDSEIFHHPAQENKRKSEQFHAFEIQEVLILFILVFAYKCKRVLRQVVVDRLS